MDPRTTFDDVTTDSSEADWIRISVATVTERLGDDGATRAEIRDLVDTELSTGLSVDTYANLDRRFAEYLGDDAGRFLLQSLVVVDLEQALHEQGVPDGMVEQLVERVRFLRGLYADRLQTAQLMSGEMPDDWSSVTRELSYDIQNRVWVGRLAIEKYSTEEVILHGPATSFVNLMTQILRMLNQIPDPAPFLPSRLDEFRAEIVTFAQAFPDGGDDVATDADQAAGMPASSGAPAGDDD